MDFAGAVGREHTSGGYGRADLAEFGDGDGVLVEQLQQECLELVVGAVDLVDEQYARGGVCEGTQQRSREEEPLGVERAFRGVGVEGSGRCGFEGAQVQQLTREVPVVEGLRGVDTFVALQPDEGGQGECFGERHREGCLAGAGFPPSQKSGRPIRSARYAETARPSSAR